MHTRMQWFERKNRIWSFFFSLSFHSNGQVIFSVNVHARFVVVVVTFRFELNFHTLDFCISGNIRIERRRKNNCRPTAGEWKKMKWKKNRTTCRESKRDNPLRLPPFENYVYFVCMLRQSAHVPYIFFLALYVDTCVTQHKYQWCFYTFTSLAPGFCGKKTNNFQSW